MTVLVVGGGIAGLTAGFELMDAGIDVEVLEAGDRVGGKLFTDEWLGRRVEFGADAFLARHKSAQQLATRLGLGDDLVEPAAGQVHLWVDDRLRPLPAGTVLGAPTDLVALARSGVLSPAAMVRAGLEPLAPRRRVSGDRSVGDLLRERFGGAVVDRLAEPLLGGVYAGRVDDLSAEATTPMIAEAYRSGGSLIRALGAYRQRTVGASDAPIFQTLASGLETLPEALAGRLGDRLRRGATVTGLTRTASGWDVEVDGRTEPADAVVLCVPAYVAAELLAGAVPTAAAELASIRYASVAVVTLAYDPAAHDQLPAGSGMLVPRTEGRLVKASTWVSRKWPHQADAPYLLLRASVGRIDDDRWRQYDTDELERRVDAEIRRATGIVAPFVHARTTVWDRSLPQYDVGHRARIDRIRTALPDGVALAGAAYDGVGISPCVASAQQAVGAVVAAMRATSPSGADT